MLALFAFEFEILWEVMNVLAHIGGFTIRTADLENQEDRRQIDDFLAGRVDSGPFHRAEWLRGVERGTGQAGHYLIAQSAGKTIGLLPLTTVRSPLFGNALVSTGFGVEGGILAGAGQAAQALAEAACALAKEQDCSVVELRGGPVPAGWDRDQGLYAGFRRDLPSGEDAILKSIPRKQRAEVRRSLGEGLEIRIGRSEELLNCHYRVYGESVRNLGTPVFPRALFEAILAEFSADSDIVLVTAGDQPVAAVLSLYQGGTVYPYWGGGTQAARGLRANNLLYFALMRHASERGCTRFDFGRSKIGTGPYAFKTNWGFTPRPLTYARKGPPRDVNPLTPKRRLQAAIWKRLPLAAANRLGPVISRGLG